MFYSQIGQDKILYEYFFKNNNNGIFCDVGAHDGISSSNTYFFEKELNWSGLCIEAKPENYEKLKNSRNCHCIFGAAYNKDGTITFRSNSGYTNMLSGIEECYNELHKQRIEKEINIHGGESNLVDIPSYKLSTLFDKYDIKTVDYLSIDTEGSELQILEG